MGRINGYVGRRSILKLAGIGGMGLAAAVGGGVLWSSHQASVPQSATGSDRKTVSADEALKKLMDGNRRFVQQKRVYPGQSRSRLQETATSQFPFAAILGCADSRVPDEIIFDQGIGDIFVVRVAGNVATPEVIGSLEYSTALLGSQLIMVLGHERCGAVTAAVKEEEVPGIISSFVEEIKPAVKRVRNQSGDPVENSVVSNIKYQVELLAKNSTVFKDLIQQGKLKIVGARYDLDIGEVRLI